MAAAFIFSLNSGNACYHSVNIKIKMSTTITLTVVLYGRKFWSLALRKGHRMGMPKGQTAEKNTCIY